MGESGPSLLIESTDSMIIQYDFHLAACYSNYCIIILGQSDYSLKL